MFAVLCLISLDFACVSFAVLARLLNNANLCLSLFPFVVVVARCCLLSFDFA